MIYVRSRVGSDGKYTEWMEKVGSWKSAWSVVRGCGALKIQCKKFKSGEDWFLDIEDLKPVGVVINDRPMRYTNDSCSHLVYGGRKTLCGLDSRKWGCGVRSTVGGAYLCPKCERFAEAKGLEIPF